MKKIILIMLLAIVVIQLEAQITLTQSNNAYQIGDEYVGTDINIDGIEPGDAGENVTWDFSNLTETVPFTATVVNASNTPYTDLFSLATEAIYIDTTTTNTYYYYNSTSEALQYMGTGRNDDNHFLFYDFEKYLSYPFTYGSVFTDDYMYMFGTDYEAHGEVTVTADAYGTLITPEETFENVIRIKTEMHSLDTFFFYSEPFYFYEYENVKYQWFNNESHYPIMSIYNYHEVGEWGFEGGFGHYLTDYTTVTNIENNNSEISVFPNPSTGTFTITNYELQIMNIEITDITGKLIYKSELVIPNSQFVINKKGIYFININTENKTYTEKIIIQ